MSCSSSPILHGFYALFPDEFSAFFFCGPRFFSAGSTRPSSPRPPPQYRKSSPRPQSPSVTPFPSGRSPRVGGGYVLISCRVTYYKLDSLIPPIIHVKNFRTLLGTSSNLNEAKVDPIWPYENQGILGTLYLAPILEVFSSSPSLILCVQQQRSDALTTRGVQSPGGGEGRPFFPPKHCPFLPDIWCKSLTHFLLSP